MDVTPELKRQRLLLLAEFLESDKRDFGFTMEVFEAHEIERTKYSPFSTTKIDWSLVPAEVECGTVRCALGSAPIALNIPFEDEDFEEGEPDWGFYCERVLGIGYMEETWQFIFSGGWSNVDNTAKGAAARIRYYLDHGSPDMQQVHDMFSGIIPLCYSSYIKNDDQGEVPEVSPEG